MMTVADQIPDSTKSAAEYQPDAANQLADKLLQSIAFKVYSSDDDVIREAAAMLRTRAAPPAMDREAVEAEVERIMAMSDDEIMAEVDAEDVAWARAFKQGLRTGQHVSTADAPVKALRSIVAKHTRVGGYPDTHAIARDAYNLALSTLSADAIRQGEGVTEILSRFPTGWKVRQVQFSAPCADDRKWHVNVYGGKEGRDAFVGRGATAEAALIDAATQARAVPATPASHASDGGKA